MKRINYIVLILLTFCTTSCEDLFDIKSTTYINDEDVWKDPVAIQAVMVDLYSHTNYEDFDYYEGFWIFSLLNPNSTCDESWPSYQQGDFGVANQAQSIFGDSWFYTWPYDQIRNCNTFLERVQKADIAEADKKQIMAEVRFLRAFHYFHLAKRFGGVPLITQPQVYEGPEKMADLQIARSKEQVIWDFIGSELTEVVRFLPVSRDASNKNRANKYIAFALQSRAMLYAATIAKYGKVQLEGLVGLNASDADRYFQASFAASDSVIQSKKYELYQKYSDKATNYRSLFLDKTNTEYIWAKEYMLPDVAHGFDWQTVPYSFTQAGYGCGMNPSLEFVEAYEYTDGSKGTLKVNDANNVPIQFNNPMDLFTGKDPRMFASVFVPNDQCMGKKVEIWRGIYKSGKFPTTLSNNMKSLVTLGTGVKINEIGKDGIIDINDPTKTGFYQKKFFNEDLKDKSEVKSDQSWPVFRLAEMYLNKAEAAFELGQSGVAVEALNKVRARAGIKELNAGELTLDRVRNERRVELAFEGQRFWDLRRWRIAATPRADNGGQGILDNLAPTALYPWVVFENGKFIFTKESDRVPKPNKVFYERHYYLKFKTGETNSNPNLVQNPGY